MTEDRELLLLSLIDGIVIACSSRSGVRANNAFPGKPSFDLNGKKKGSGDGNRINLETRISPGDSRGKRGVEGDDN
jgi:hypothetical protein